MDKISFPIIIILTTIVSYVFIRKYFKMNPKYLGYAVVGIFFGLIFGLTVGWPAPVFLGTYGIVVAPYIMGIILMGFIEFFIIDGINILKYFKKKRNVNRQAGYFNPDQKITMYN